MLLIDDLIDSFDALTQPVRDWLRDRGVSDPAMLQWPGQLGIVRIETYNDGLFDLNDHGLKAIIQPVNDGGQCSDVIDTLAWQPSDPSTVWLHLGMASILDDVEALDPDRPTRIVVSTAPTWIPLSESVRHNRFSTVEGS